jgi:ketosteroid isomerase-like protein
MKQVSLLLSFLALSILCTSCDGTAKNEEAAMVKSESTEADMSAVKTEIQSLENAWADAMMKKDVNALVALYSDDAVSMQDGAPTLTGKAAIQAQIEKDFAAPPRFASIAFQTLNVYGRPDEVTEVGTSVEKDESGKVLRSGKYMVVFKKMDGKYKAVSEIYNKDGN